MYFENVCRFFFPLLIIACCVCGGELLFIEQVGIKGQGRCADTGTLATGA